MIPDSGRVFSINDLGLLRPSEHMPEREVFRCRGQEGAGAGSGAWNEEIFVIFETRQKRNRRDEAEETPAQNVRSAASKGM